MRIAFLLFIAISLFVQTAVSALVPLSPVGGQKVALVPDAQKKVMALPTLADRLQLFRDDKANGKVLKNDKFWRKSLPLVLEVLATADEPGPWKVMIGKRPDLSDARTIYVITGKLDPSTGRVIEGGVTGDVARLEVPWANLEVGTRYYWRVGCRGKCSWDCHPKHGCTNCTVYAETPVSTFVTEDVAPRWIALEGRVGNVRDLGGRTTSDGRRVRQGLVYRGQGLNDNSATGEIPGRNRLTVEDVRYLTGELGIRTDLDLRGPWETADMAVSPLGEGVRLVVRPSPCYKGIFDAAGRKTMAANFRVFCDRANYPIYFHCIGGADRTGSLAYVLNAVLGVSRRELETDWEATFYPRIPDVEPDPGFWRRESHFNDGFSKYGDASSTWNERIVLYLKDCGITDAEIAAFRAIMLEDRPLHVAKHVVEIGLERSFSVLHVTDSHLTRIDARDGDALHAYAQKRSRNGRGHGAHYLDEAVVYARQCGLRLIHTGDFMEFASMANFESAERCFSADAFLACVGNHEYWTAGANRAQESEIYKSKTMPQVKKAFATMPCQTVAYGGVNFFVFDNAFDDVTEGIAEAFEETVRQGCPIVLVCHVPFALAGVDNSLACGAPSSRSSDMTRSFVERVRRETLVKAILCGHTHVSQVEQFSPSAQQFVGGALYNGEAEIIEFR